MIAAVDACAPETCSSLPGLRSHAWMLLLSARRAIHTVWNSCA